MADMKIVRKYEAGPEDVYTEELIEEHLINTIRGRLHSALLGRKVYEAKVLMVATMEVGTEEVPRTTTFSVGNMSRSPIPWMVEVLKIAIRNLEEPSLESLSDLVIEYMLRALPQLAEESILRAAHEHIDTMKN